MLFINIGKNSNWTFPYAHISDNAQELVPHYTNWLDDLMSETNFVYL